MESAAINEMTADPVIILLVEDDPDILEILAMALERGGRTVVACSDAQSAEVVIDTMPITCMLADARLSGPMVSDGLDLVRYVATHSPRTAIGLMTGDGSPALRREAEAHGATAFLQKPFSVEAMDAVVESLIGEFPLPTRPSPYPPLLLVPMLGDILRKELLEAVLEPAIRITRSGEEIRGYESQLRLKSEGPLQKSKDLFRYAEKKTRVEDLELARLDRTLRAGAKIAAQTLLFVNIHPLALSADGRVCTALLRGAAANRIPIENLVVVITNQALHDDLHLEALAETGIAVALEDEDGSLRFLLDNAAIRCSH